MRTTLTLPDAQYERIVALARARKIPLKEAVAEVVGRGLDAVERIAATPYRFEIQTHKGGPTNPNANYDKIADLLEADDVADGRGW